MKQAEKIIGIFVIVAMIARLLYDYPYASNLIVFPAIFLSLLYFFFSFLLLNDIRLRNVFKKESYKSMNALRIVGTIASGVVFFIILTGILFKFQNWPYGNYNLYTGLMLLFSISIFVIIKFIIKKAAFYRNVLIRFFIIGGIGLILLLVSQEQLIEIKYRDYPEYIEAEKALLKDPYNETLIQKAKEESIKMNSK
jgi:hypothetical protein